MRAVITSEIARNLDQVGDRWTLLILRDLFLGRHRFEALKSHTGVSRATLSRRLQSLISSQIIVKTAYSDSRFEYQLTPKGRDLYPAAMLAWQWEITHLPTEGVRLPGALFHSDCGQPLRPRVQCAACGEALRRDDVRLADGAASLEQQIRSIGLENSQTRKRASSLGRDQSMVRIAELVGDRWSILILVAICFGVSRFDEFTKLLGIATNVLGQRLNQLVTAQVVTREAYQQNPPRHRYLLSPQGDDLYGFIMAVWQWAKHWTEAGERANGLVHVCGAPLVVEVSCSNCDKSLALNV